MGFIHRIVAVGSAAIIGAGAALVAVAPASAVGAADWAAFTAAVNGSAGSIELGGDIEGTGGVALPAGRTLTLDLNGHALTVSAPDNVAGIRVPPSATLVITDTSPAHNGVLTASSGQYAAGIGGNMHESSGAVRVDNGTVVANGSLYGSGIGGGIGGGSGAITVTGGTVTATAGNYAAGIGSSSSATTGPIVISGGTVTANGGAYGAGIGGGSGSTSGSVSITGGTVTANGGNYGPGIGAAWHGTLVSVSIMGGIVSATGGDRANGIGGATGTAGVPVTIGAGAAVTAAGASFEVVNGVRVPYSAVGGDPTLAFGSLSVAGTLTIPAGASLVVPAVATVSVDAAGAIVNNGTIDLTGAISGAVANHGVIFVRTGGVVDPAAVSDHNYAVVFDPADGSETTAMRLYASTFTAGGLSAPGTPSRDGYTFAGWYPVATGGTAWTVNTSLSADTTLTARWNRIIQPFTTPVSAVITGPAVVGSTLTATVTADSAPAAESYEYQWLAGGDPIDGATAATYVPTAADLERQISVVVSPVTDGYDSATGATETDPTAPVGAGSFTSNPTVEIVGTAVAGGELVAQIVDEAVPTPTGYTFRWYADDLEIEDGTGQAFTPTRFLIGTRISVKAYPLLDGYTPSTGVASSAATVPVAGQSFGGFIGVKVVGTPQVGRTVTAQVQDGLEPFAESFSYAWKANGVLLQVGPSSELALDRVQAGAALTVTVTASTPGYEPVEVASQPVTVVSAPSLAVSLASVPAGASVTVSGEHFVADPEVTLELHSDVVVVGVVEPSADGTFTSSFTVGAGVAPGVHHVVAVDADGRELASVELTVTPATASGAEASGAALASTGSESPLPAALTAALLALAGLVLALRARRRGARA
ncbi:InlB B-repeat-containing protein [Leifsonia sp. NPDC058194]|uniref:InlB B-repeat-containing protein n=1 Tax=Leifsonia sp. NPDC058194 TaxID=3346374 RepID=UPI0036DF8352